ALGYEIAQRDLQVGAGVAAQAAVAEQRDFVGRAAHERVVDADAAELIDDDGGACTFGRRQETAQQRGLAGAEKAGDDADRNARAARVLAAAPERACLARGEKVEQNASTFASARGCHRPRKRTIQ